MFSLMVQPFYALKSIEYENPVIDLKSIPLKTFCSPVDTCLPNMHLAQKYNFDRKIRIFFASYRLSERFFFFHISPETRPN